ncbi:MAG: FIG00481961: hypothetical protein, partial [uncultured Microvirga sp.]
VSGTPDAESDGCLARRQHLAFVRSDRRFLQPPSSRGEGDRGRRGGGRDQGVRSGLEWPARPRGDRARREGCRSSAQDGRVEGQAAPGQADQERAALHARVAAPGPAERDPVAAAQSSRAEGRTNHAARRHDEDDDSADPRPHPLELGRPPADGPRHAGPRLADRPRFRGPARREGQARSAATGRGRPEAASGRGVHRPGACARRLRGERARPPPGAEREDRCRFRVREAEAAQAAGPGARL